MARSTVERHAHPKFDRLYLLRRDRSKFYYAETFLDGKKSRVSLKASALPLALRLAEDWYRKLLRASVQVGNRHPFDRLATDPTVSEVFKSYRTTLTPSKQAYADMKWSTIQTF